LNFLIVIIFLTVNFFDFSAKLKILEDKGTKEGNAEGAEV
jgi:hypothetical protein